jgi:hypothetical protein
VPHPISDLLSELWLANLSNILFPLEIEKLYSSSSTTTFL